MADNEATRENSMPNSAAPADTRVVWLAAAGMICLLLLAVVSLIVAFMLQKSVVPAAAPVTTAQSAPININIDSNNQGPLAKVEPVKPDPMLRPDKSSEKGSRLSGQVSAAPAGPLPGKSQSQPTRAEKPSDASGTLPIGKVYIRVRSPINQPTGIKGTVPFHVGPDGRANIYAAVPQGGDEASFSYLPDVVYRPSSSNQGQSMSLRVSSPRKTSAIGQLRAPSGFQFFTADVEVSNGGSQGLLLEADLFEVRDADHVPYLPNTELLAASFPSRLAAGSQASFHAAFLVPANAHLTALLAREPGDGLISAPLSQP